KVAGCYADDAVSYHADTPQKATGGQEIAQQMMGHIVKGFPDFEAHDVVVLVNGNKVQALILGTGTNDGSFIDMPPTHKKIGVYGLRSIEFSGDKIKNDVHFTDPATWLGQLGAMKLPHRAPAAPPAAPIIVQAKGDKTEDDNVAVVNQ